MQERIDDGGPKYSSVHNLDELVKTACESQPGKRVRVQEGPCYLSNQQGYQRATPGTQDFKGAATGRCCDKERMYSDKLIGCENIIIK